MFDIRKMCLCAIFIHISRLPYPTNAYDHARHFCVGKNTNGREHDVFTFYCGSHIQRLCILPYLVASQSYPVSHTVGLNVLHHTVMFESKVGLSVS
jgi:hypothetical protein